jgi:heparan-alpha-glucosaminide N-acetyltransferase
MSEDPKGPLAEHDFRADDPSAAPPPAIPQRLASVDAYRGLVMFLMMAEVLHLRQVARAAGGRVLKLLAYHQTHVEWVGCSLHDMIQPSFSFLVGVALPFSVASRLARGQSKTRMTVHALWRSLILVFLGVFLRSTSRSQTYFTFEDTLSQIGLGYTFLFVLAFFSARIQWLALGIILLGYGAAFASYPAPGADFDFAKVGVPANWPDHPTGFAAHWDKNSNIAWAFDTWFLNVFPREKAFEYNGGGYATLSFIPTLGTMILGLLAGGLLKSQRPGWAKPLALIVAGVALTACGFALGELGVCPVVKKIWTPSWVLFSGGVCCVFLATFYATLDLTNVRFWAFPLRVIGMNSIAAYCMADLIEPFISKNLVTHLGKRVFNVLGAPYQPLLQGAGVLLVIWLILFWMYRRKLFLRI